MKSRVSRVEKPWGHELIFARTGRYAGKLLFIRGGHRLSLQYHREKEETIYLYRGRLSLLFEEEGGELAEIEMGPGESHHIPPGRRHRMVALEDCEVFEVSTPQLDDVVRLEDQYGRVP